MDQIQLAIILLTIIVTLLAAIIAIMLVLIVIVLIKVNKVASQAKLVTENLTSATAWLSPTTVFSAAVRAFRKR